MRIRDREVSHKNNRLTIYYLAVIIAFILIIYFMNFDFVLTMILELILIPLTAAILLISYFIGENLFVTTYHNFLKHLHKQS